MSKIIPTQINNDEPIKCRYCSSTNVIVGEKGFSLGGAVAGFLTMGILGSLIAGNLGRKDLELTCLSCGERWYPFDPFLQDMYREEDHAKRHKEHDEKFKNQQDSEQSSSAPRTANKNEVEFIVSTVGSAVADYYMEAMEKQCTVCGRDQSSGVKIVFLCERGHVYCDECSRESKDSKKYKKDNLRRGIFTGTRVCPEVIPRRGIFSTTKVCSSPLTKIPRKLH